MANFFAIIFVTILSLLLSACNSSEEKDSRANDATLKVVTTFTVIADMAKNVAGDSATVLSITRPGAEIHNYKPTPKDIAQAEGVDLILWNGLGLELWFERFLQHLDGVDSATVTDGESDE